MVGVCREAMAMPDPGDILMFLPGTHEIRKTIELLETRLHHPWLGRHPPLQLAPPAAQDAQSAPARPKIIVATNVAETSLTIEGVRTVIDSGLARIASFDRAAASTRCSSKKISRASAEQRAGRAGRTAPGRAFRLVEPGGSQPPRRIRSTRSPPRRSGGSRAAAQIRRRLRDPRFPLARCPPEDALVRAELLLHDLGALDSDRHLTDEGRKMAALPLEPRFSRLMLAGHEHGCVAETAFIAAAVQGEGMFSNKRGGSAARISSSPTTAATSPPNGAPSTPPRRWISIRNAAPNSASSPAARAKSPKGFDRLQKLAQRFGWVEGVDFATRREAVGRAMLAASATNSPSASTRAPSPAARRQPSRQARRRLLRQTRRRLRRRRNHRSRSPRGHRPPPPRHRHRPRMARACFPTTSSPPTAPPGTNLAAASSPAKKPASATLVLDAKESDHHVNLDPPRRSSPRACSAANSR
jgi:ATP-dependent helicase HrpB